ncbi:hypothetical protein [Terrihabitans rhizophilus]|uniref:Uncharacterized protein n=1 Tax=Terrihabitans rhizophilus TaxID=3092662 RepID=A0ABU4RRQ2_9HYPH|nr:hypothetical protein [Terrihabitans sp. PJ23]MDX6806310.1 hypothetical protein [Terrihabitans sp. PJ23]
MSNRLLTAEAEILEPSDFDDMTLFPQAAIDNLVEDAIAYPAHWARFTVSAAANTQVVTVSPGRYHEDRTVFEATGVQDVNLQAYLPVVVSDERWVALILRGRTDIEEAIRPFKDLAEDADDASVVMRSTPNVERRVVGIVVQQGLASPAPALRPVVADTDCCIAFVRLTSAGVQTIVPSEGHRVKPLYEVEGRVTALEVNLAALFLRTTTLETDLANANSAINDLRRAMVRPEIIRQIRRDVAAMRQQNNVPAGARSDWYDPGLLYDQWDPNHAQWRSRVDEGIHHPYANQKEAQLQLVTEDDPRIRFTGRRMMPAWSEVTRMSNWGGTATRDISQTTHSEVNAIRREVARSKLEYGETIHICENAKEWSRYSPDLQASRTFSKNGETFETVGLVKRQDRGHNIYAVRTVKKIEWTDVYWDYVTTEIGVNGSVHGETILVSQPTIATSIDLDFSRVGNDGDVHLFLCETDPTGAPVVTAVLANVTKPRSELVLGANKFNLPPTYLTPGNRYAWFTVTVGNHQLRGTTGNAYSGGTSFRLTDGAWAQGDLEFDFNFRLNAARFANTRTVVNFQPVTLENGMTELMLLYANWRPDGTAIEWEIRTVDELPWSFLDVAEDGPLASLPSLVQLRCTMLATPDLAPMIVMDAFAVSRTARPAPELRAVSEAINLGLTTTTIQTLTTIDDFDPAVQGFSPRIMAGASQTLIAPDVSTTIIDQDRPERREVLSTYTVPAGTSVVRNAPGLTTTNIVLTAFLENTALFAL